MTFEEFIREQRILKGLSQKVIAERTGTTHQNISSYERHRSTCSFDVGVEILDALGLTVLIKNRQIIIQGEEGMNETNNTKYERKDLDFINFNPADAYKMRDERITRNENLNKRDLEKAFKKLSDAGFDVYCSRFFDENLWDADHYPVGEYLVNISKDGKEMRLLTSGGCNIDMFIFETFIEDIKSKYPAEGAYIEKVLLFEAIHNNKGSNIYSTFKYKKPILHTLPLLDGYEDIVEETLNSKDYFFTLEEGFNPRELTISDAIGIYDCYSSSYPYFAFEMPDGEIVMSDESFEGHDIADALNYAIQYFEKDYEYYLKEYEDEANREYLFIL